MCILCLEHVKHIDTAGETDDSENIKMFTDYYLISGAQKVYSYGMKECGRVLSLSMLQELEM